MLNAFHLNHYLTHTCRWKEEFFTDLWFFYLNLIRLGSRNSGVHSKWRSYIVKIKHYKNYSIFQKRFVNRAPQFGVWWKSFWMKSCSLLMFWNSYITIWNIQSVTADFFFFINKSIKITSINELFHYNKINKGTSFLCIKRFSYK